MAAPAAFRDAVRELGHEVVEPADADVVVLDLAEDVPRTPAIPRVAWIPRLDSSDRAELDRRTIETVADAFIVSTRRLGDAIRWVLDEDRSRRTIGAPRLTIIGSVAEDLGAERLLTTEITLGRARSFQVHPMRPDAIGTHASSIARLHARVRWVDGVIALRDLQSTNGTLVIRGGQPAIQLISSGFGSEEHPWLIRDQTNDWVELRIGDQVQLPGFWRFRVDGDASFRPDDI